MAKYILAIDQGTSGTKAIIYQLDGEGVAHGQTLNPVARGESALKTRYPQAAYVEQEPAEILASVRSGVQCCLQKAPLCPSQIEIAAISNQRETFVLWDGRGQAICPAIVWSCKRSVDICREWLAQGLEEDIHRRTGLKIDPYFSASKLVQLSRTNPAVAKALAQRDCYFGTIDSWLLFSLTGEYSCDSTNASRTLFFNLDTMAWDRELLALYGLQNLHLPAVKPSAALYGKSNFWGLLPREIPIHAMIGDSSASAVGSGCTMPGSVKATLGTGASLLLNTGTARGKARGHIETLCFTSAKRRVHATEGIIVSFGSSINFLRSGLNLFDDFAEAQEICQMAQNDGVFILPAYSGLGAPFWKMEAKAAILGLTLATSKAQIIRAAYEAMAFLLCAAIWDMRQETGPIKIGPVETGTMEINPIGTNSTEDAKNKIFFDGGLIKNSFLMQLIADLLGEELQVSADDALSAKGAAVLACCHAYRAAPESFPGHRQSRKRKNRLFVPDGERGRRASSDYQEWLENMTRHLGSI